MTVIDGPAALETLDLLILARLIEPATSTKAILRLARETASKE